MAKITVRFKYSDDEEDVAFFNVSESTFMALFFEELIGERIVARNHIKKALKHQSALLDATFKEMIDIEAEEL
ncbi:MAG: hypothetical protein R3Y18_00040 [Bacillota bacterium]